MAVMPSGVRPIIRFASLPTARISWVCACIATTVLALPLHEASVKSRTGDPDDEDVDVEAGGVWAGVIPLRTVGADPVTGADVEGVDVPEHVRERAAGLM